MSEQWYTNKDLFEQIQKLSGEMKETRLIIKKYNGLRKAIDEVKEEVETLQAKAAGRSSVWNDIRVWGSWIITLGSLLFAALTFLLHTH